MNRQPRFILSRLAQTYYEEFFFFFLLVLAFSIPTSRLVMSMSQIALASLWVFDLRYREKIKRFFQNKVALILSSLFALHLLGLFYTSDFDAALNDLRIKLPLLLLPFFFTSSKQFTQKKAFWVLIVFVAGVFYATAFTSVENWISGQDIESILSDRFIKHMRFSMSINQAIFSLILLLFIEWKNWWSKILALVLIFWFLLFMLKMGALSAYVGFVFLLVFLLVYSLTRTTGRTFIFSIIGVFISLIIVSYFALSFISPRLFNDQIMDGRPLGNKTALGNDYYHLPADVFENGKSIYVYVCEKELNEQWKRRSTIPFYGTDKQGQELKATLIRYLTSLDLRKDSLGLSKLSDEDIQNIESGIANVNYTSKSGFEIRLMELAFELEQYKNNSNPSGYSLAQRREYWKVARHMIKKAWFFGSGAGDNDAKMKEGFQETKTQLSPDLWLHPHNQFLSFQLSFGILGTLVFLLVLVYAPMVAGGFRNPYYWLFYILVLASFFVEDTLETQSGATYFAFFNAFFLILWPRDSEGVRGRWVFLREYQ